MVGALLVGSIEEKTFFFYVLTISVGELTHFPTCQVQGKTVVWNASMPARYKGKLDLEPERDLRVHYVKPLH